MLGRVVVAPVCVATLLVRCGTAGLCSLVTPWCSGVKAEVTERCTECKLAVCGLESLFSGYDKLFGPFVQSQRDSNGPCVYRANAQQPKLFVGMILILIFAEALALYGLIGASLAPPVPFSCW